MRKPVLLGRLSAALGDHPRRALAAVAAAGALVSTLLLPWAMPLGWDELVYATRFPSYADGLDVEFSAPRTRGVPLLLAPVALWSDSVVLLRLWLTLLWPAALYLGFLPWLRILRPNAVVVAAACYTSIWSVLFYAAQAMPNHYTAMGTLAAVGCLVPRQATFAPSRRPARTLAAPAESPSTSSTRTSGRHAESTHQTPLLGGRTLPDAAPAHRTRTPLSYAGIVTGLAMATLMRPNDGAWAALPLFAALVVVPAWRSRATAAAVMGGVAAGLLPWIVEAELRFGSVAHRLSEASEVQGGLRPVFALPWHVAALDGRLLCRPCDADAVTWQGVSLWLLLIPLAALGVWAAGRPAPGAATDDTASGARRAVRLAVITAGCTAAPYFFLVPYAAPRFLFPSYALLAPPAALGLLCLRDAVRRSRSRTRGRFVPRAAGLLAAAVLTAHVLGQVLLAYGHGRIQEQGRLDWERVARVLHDQGVRTPCTLGSHASRVPLAYTAGCQPTKGRQPDAYVLLDHEPPRWARDWPRHSVPGAHDKGWSVLVRPGP
uniref:hypothetical protein n=1 Tax=Streptomyces polyasparticus TaxID=2767826 RepID=UPI001BE42C18|nr:hypothetical protein [Streptomyces polyasparticus]